MPDTDPPEIPDRWPAEGTEGLPDTEEEDTTPFNAKGPSEMPDDTMEKMPETEEEDVSFVNGKGPPEMPDDWPNETKGKMVDNKEGAEMPEQDKKEEMPVVENVAGENKAAKMEMKLSMIYDKLLNLNKEM